MTSNIFTVQTNKFLRSHSLSVKRESRTVIYLHTANIAFRHVIRGRYFLFRCWYFWL